MNKKMFVMGLLCMVSMVQTMDQANTGFSSREMVEFVEWTEEVSSDLVDYCTEGCEKIDKVCDKMTEGHSEEVEAVCLAGLCIADVTLQVVSLL